MKTESQSPKAVREWCRAGGFTGRPREHAFDFLLFCQRNPKPCPLVDVLDPGKFAPSCAPDVPLYKTNIPCLPAGRFEGNMVVGMRPINSRDVACAVEISSQFPQVHGAPVHVGHPDVIGSQTGFRRPGGDAGR